MRVSVYKRESGVLDVLVEASVGKGRSPRLLEGVTAENVVEKVLPVVVAMRRPRGSTQTGAPL